MNATRKTFALASAILFIATVISHYLLSPYLSFVLAALTLGGFAALIGASIEKIGLYYSLPLTSSLQAILASIPLIFIVIFFLVKGESAVAQAVIVGAILANGLLVLGLAFISGALKSGTMRFDKRISSESSILFIMAVMGLAFTGAAASGNDYSEENLHLISAIVSVILLLTYFVWLYNHIKSAPVLREEVPDRPFSILKILPAIILPTVGSALIAWWIVEDAKPIIEAFSLSPLFVGAVLFPLVTSAAGNTSSILLARKEHPKLAIALVQGSIAQITVFVFPALVLFSFFLNTQLTLAISPLFITALGISGLVIRQISNDGEAQLFEGVALVGSFLILATLVYFVPMPL